MIPNSPIAQEIRRQIAQGFLEPKKGILGPHLNFDLKGQGLLITRKHTLYRKDDNDLYGLDGEALLELPVSAYKPFHKVVETIIPIIGEDGKAYYSNFHTYHDQDGDRCWTWDPSEELADWKEALKKYRYAVFGYTAKNGNSLTFYSDNDTDKKIGKLEIEFPFRKLGDLELKTVNQVAIFLQNIKQ